jgi:hypothetical protein
MKALQRDGLQSDRRHGGERFPLLCGLAQRSEIRDLLRCNLHREEGVAVTGRYQYSEYLGGKKRERLQEGLC